MQTIDYDRTKIKFKYRDCPASGNNSIMNPKIVLKVIGDPEIVKQFHQGIKKLIANILSKESEL